MGRLYIDLGRGLPC